MANQITLLLVEDNLAVREALTKVLISENYAVRSASSGAQAVLTHKEQPIHLVLLDLNLGDEDGWKVFQALKEIRSDLPIIVTSAQPDRLAHPSATRADGALEKPFDIPVLLGLITKATRSGEFFYTGEQVCHRLEHYPKSQDTQLVGNQDHRGADPLPGAVGTAYAEGASGGVGIPYTQGGPLRLE